MSRKPYRHMTVYDRQKLGILKKKGYSNRKIAAALGFHPSTIGRELKRGCTRFGYCCYLSQYEANYRRSRSNRKRSSINKRTIPYIIEKLNEYWSPQQIAGTFDKVFALKVSYVSIYRWLNKSYISQRLELKSKLRRKGKRNMAYSRRKQRLAQRPMISSRPDSTNKKWYFGDWEADLMEGPKDSKKCVLVLVERKSKFTLLRALKNAKSANVAQSIVRALQPYKVRSITYDNGSEFMKYRYVEEKTNSRAYFCNPYHSWEKGLVENTIGLLRQYFPKKIVLPEGRPYYRLPQNQLNSRPRFSLGYKTPNDFLPNITK